MGDVYCAKCREPWEAYYLRHDLPKEAGFVRSELTGELREALAKDGWRFGDNILCIRQCPGCHDLKLEGEERDEWADRVALQEAAASVLGDDLDGFQAEMEDYEEMFW